MQSNALRRRMLFAMVTCLLAGCGRSDGVDRTAAPSEPQFPAATVESGDPTLRDYYAGLVATHGEDIATCPQAESAGARACAKSEITGMPPAPRRVLLMLDASGSMAGRQNGQTKLVIAQDALVDFATRLEGDAQVALRVYGHRGGNREQDKAESCRASDLLQPFAPRDPAAFETAVRSFQPSGFTPIASSLDAAAHDFADGGANAQGNVIYLVSDGVETCDGDPVAAARALRASGIGVVVNVIGFDVDAAAERQLRSVADAGGGDYLSARSRKDVVDLFNRRLAAINARFNCRVRTASDAYNRTVKTNAERYNCIVRKAGSEFNAIVAAATADAKAGRATQAQRSYAMEQASAKRDGIVEPAKVERDAAVSRSSTARGAGVDAASADRDAADRQARGARSE